MTRRLLTLVLLAALATGAGCSWGGREPGLFRTPEPSPTAETSASLPAPAPTNPDLPVLGESVWTSADGSALPVRFAVHALRRTANATVLDWSVTPLAGQGRPAGASVPSSLDLGLTDALAGEQNLLLLDGAGRRAYRPLAHVAPQEFGHCLCTPIFAVEPTLRFGETRLLQLTFPALPAELAFVDVQLPNVATVAHVPLTPVGSAPHAVAGVDLTRAADEPAPAAAARTYAEPGLPRRRQSVRVDRVVAGAGFTSVVWTTRSVSDQDGYVAQQSGPPVAVTLAADASVLDAYPATGPRLTPAGRTRPVLGARWITADSTGLRGYTCVCSEFGLWAKGLRLSGGTATVETSLPAVPAGTRTVDVTFPGLPSFRDVPVTVADDAALRSGPPVPVDPALWDYDREDPPRGWSSDDWPTPLPDPMQVGAYQSRTEALVDTLP